MSYFEVDKDSSSSLRCCYRFVVVAGPVFHAAFFHNRSHNNNITMAKGWKRKKVEQEAHEAFKNRYVLCFVPVHGATLELSRPPSMSLSVNGATLSVFPAAASSVLFYLLF